LLLRSKPDFFKKSGLSIRASCLLIITFASAGDFHSGLLMNSLEFSCKQRYSSYEILGKQSEKWEIISSMLRKMGDLINHRPQICKNICH